MLCNCTPVHPGLLASIGPPLPDGQSAHRIALCIRRVNSAGPEASVDREARHCDDPGDHLR
jgi:hypothetical protein